jgi:DNA helicase-2/ATP-dependent DNA helicase PcrA
MGWKGSDQNRYLHILLMNLLDELNPQQQKVVTTTEGPVLVLAGAGSGKTRCVTYRTAYLINKKKVKPWNILVVTFTNKAARELKDRLTNTLRFPVNNLWIGTFHSICTRILRREEAWLPVNSRFTIFDDDDQKAIMKRLFKELNIDTHKFPLNKVRNIISRQKNSIIQPQDFFDFNDHNFYTEMVHKIYERYQSTLLKYNSLDFDDLLMYVAILLHDNQEIRKKYAELFKYVMIDEYQDTNYVQFKIINLIAQEHQNLCVVGDDDQAIYSWRGADIRNILNFENDYKNVKTIKLERNYRSPVAILNLANDIIKHNENRHPKQLWTSLNSEIIPRVVKLENEKNEAEYVADRIRQVQAAGGSLDECVVLYRTNAQSRVFESVFLQERLNYQIIGGVNFLQRKEIKDIIAYLRFINNPADAESFFRIVNFPPRGIGKVSEQKLQGFTADKGLTLQQALDNLEKTAFNKSLINKLQQLNKLLGKWRKESVHKPVNDLVKGMIEELELIGFYEKSSDPKDIARIENIREFIAAAEEFTENFRQNSDEIPLLANYLQDIALQTDLDNVDDEMESVKLMTMHNAKGLEFNHVFAVGLEENLLPHILSLENEHQLEEERRLLYVSITRAKKTVELTYTRSRRVYDSVMNTLPSRFVVNITDSLVQLEDLSLSGFSHTDHHIRRERPIITVRESEKYFKIGQKIAHSKFGKGVILNVDGKGKDAKLTISFSTGQLKKIVGNYVKKL